MSKQMLLAVLQRPIAFHRVFAQISGSVTSGLFLSQLFYWHDKGKDPDGWIYKTYAEWTAETTMSRRELDTARKRLKELDLIEEKKTGVPAQLFYRINFEALIPVLNSAEVTNKNGGKRQTEVAESAKQEWRKAPNSLLYTETTSEISSETTASRADDEKLDPFYNGQVRAIAREVVKQQRSSAAPRHFLNDGPWAELANETQKTPADVFHDFRLYLEELAKLQGKRDPESWGAAIATSLFQQPGSEVACKPWRTFSDHYRQFGCAPDVTPLTDTAIGQTYQRFANVLDQFED